MKPSSAQRWSPADLVTIGWFAKRFAPRPEWLHAPSVELVCSASDFAAALQLLRRFAAGGPEPGPYQLVEVWAERDPLAEG